MRRIVIIVGSILIGALSCMNSRPMEGHEQSLEGRVRVRSEESRGDGIDDSKAPQGQPNFAGLEPPSVRRTPELCPHSFTPSLVPVEPPVINPNNGERAVRRRRAALERIEVIDAVTYRVLHEVDAKTVDSVRVALATAPPPPHPELRTGSLPAWPVALLFYFVGELQPYLGWYFDDGAVYFVAEDDPWDVAVFEPDGDAYRDVFPVVTSDELGQYLDDRFGEYDPLGLLTREAQRAEDARCGRVSQPRGEPFPHLPRARIDSDHEDLRAASRPDRSDAGESLADPFPQLPKALIEPPEPAHD